MSRNSSYIPLQDLSRHRDNASSSGVSDAGSASSPHSNNNGNESDTVSRRRSRGQTMVSARVHPKSGPLSGPDEDRIEERVAHETDDDSTRGGSSFDSILTIDEAADIIAEERESNAREHQQQGIGRFWPFRRTAGYRAVGGSGGYRRHGEEEPIWSKRMLVLPAVMLISMGIMYVVISGVAWYRNYRDNPHVDIDANLFPPLVNLDMLSEYQYPVRLVHTNDLHAHFSPFNAKSGDTCSDATADGCIGGSAVVKSIIDHLRLANDVGKENSILLNAGDEFQGSIYYSLFKGNMSAALLNSFGYDALTLGNHEFDEGPGHLAKYLTKVHVPAICANIKFTEPDSDLQANIQPYTIIDRHHIGIIGVLTPDTAASSSVGNGIQLTDPVEAVNKARMQLEKQGIRRVVVLSHLGYDADRDLAQRIDAGVSLVIGGHSHTYLSNDDSTDSEGPYPTWVTNSADSMWQTAVVQAKKWGEYVGYLDLVFSSDGSLDSELTKGSPVSVDISPSSPLHNRIKPNQHILDIIQPFEEETRQYTEKVIGQATKRFDGPDRATDRAELALGDLVTDALVWSDRAKHAKLAFISTGAIRDHIPEGKITRGHVLRALPFDDTLVLATLSGKEIRNMVVASQQGKNSNMEGTPNVLSSIQVSGLRFNATVIEVTMRIGNVDHRPMRDVEWETLDDAKHYDVLTDSFVLGGGDNLLATTVQGQTMGVGFRDAVEKYIVKFSPIEPVLDKRIQQ
ncbi:hypothetical protein FBU59_000343 [Linderina macrospora]|uniref:Uncharacterized protein n=1 Tax=Linderina macrospora TaxID=4868 RepID=A0ACC1JH53_9FUNG|nr:hypothetical protein FBU59_000343 [Linderina macrospora]